MRNFFLIILCLVSVSAFAEKWHWKHDDDNKEFERELANAAALNAYKGAYSTGNYNSFKKLDEERKEKEKLATEYEPFTSPEPLKRFLNTIFISDEGNKMMYIDASMVQIDGKETLVLEFLKNWKIKQLTAKEAFEIITVEGHPFGQEKTVPNEEINEGR